MLTGQKILTQLNQHAAEIYERFRVRQIGLFGSYVREEARPESDIDILVEFIAPTFDQYMELKFYLESLFNQPVDLVLIDSLKPRLKPTVLEEVEYAQRSQVIP